MREKKQLKIREKMGAKITKALSFFKLYRLIAKCQFESYRFKTLFFELFEI
jgi:hypothetical protein